MYRIAIVEDQEFVRSAIASIISKQCVNFEVCALYGNGQELIEDISNSKPDIILTDIKMPILNGIEMAKIISRKYPTIKIIILSGYGDFEFAQQAVKYGVFDYLLKPCKEEELIDTLQKVAVKLDEQSSINQLRNWYTNSYTDNLPSLRQQAIISLFYNYKTSIGNYDFYGLESFLPPFAVWVIFPQISHSVFGETEDDVFLYGCCNILNEMMDKVLYKEFFTCNNNVVCLVSLNDVSEQEVNYMVESATKLINQVFDCSATFSRGCNVSSLVDCGVSYCDALKKIGKTTNSLNIPQNSTDNLSVLNAIKYIKQKYYLDIGLD